MISTDFAPNEAWDDAWISLKNLFQPWLWKKGEECQSIKQKLVSKLFPNNHIGIDRAKMVNLFLSGRSALYYLLQSINLPKGSEVLVQAFTCEAVVLPIIGLGLK